MIKPLSDSWGGRSARSSLRALAGLSVTAAVLLCTPASLGQSGNSQSGSRPAAQDGQRDQDQKDPFAPKPPQVRELPSILERDEQGRVVWILGDPSRRVIEVMDLSQAQRRELRRIMAERDAQLLRAAVPNLDKVVRALQAHRNGEVVEFDTFAGQLLASLGAFGRRGAFHVDAEVRRAMSRGAYSDLNIVLREYNKARVDEERPRLEAEFAAAGAEPSEIALRDSTILQRFQRLDMVTDAARMLEERLGGWDELVRRHPRLESVEGPNSYWVALSELTDEESARFVRELTGLAVEFPSPDGEAALAPLSRQASEQAQGPQAGPAGHTQAAGNSGNAGGSHRPERPRVSAQSDVQRDADGNFSFTDEELEVLRVNATAEPAILKRDSDGLAVRLDENSFIAAYKAMRDAGLVSELEVEEFDLLLEDRDRVFDEQVLRLYEFLVESASFGPVEEGPLPEAVLNSDWEIASTMFGAWLNEKLPAPSTVHNDLRVREVLEWDNLVQMSRIANDYDGGHIFDARIELLKMVRDREDMNDSAVALPGNIKRPWRLQQIMRDAKRSYATQLRVTEPDFRQALAELDLEGQAATLVEELAAADGPMTESEFWDVAVKLPLEAHRELIKNRTGYEAPEPGYFVGKTPSPTTGAPSGG